MTDTTAPIWYRSADGFGYTSQVKYADPADVARKNAAAAAPTLPSAPVVREVGRDTVGIIAESAGMLYYLTHCCHASAKGSSNSPTGVCCRACYRPVSPDLGGVPSYAAKVAPAPRRTPPAPRPTGIIGVEGDTANCPVCNQSKPLNKFPTKAGQPGVRDLRKCRSCR